MEMIMKKHYRLPTMCLLTAASLAATLAGQAPAPAGRKPDSAQVRQHVEQARKAAGAEWSEAATFFCNPDANRANRPDDPLLEPAKIFDNLYVMGRTGTAVFAITTSEGIVLIDSGYADQLESVLLPQMIKLGLDPAKVKYIILGHGHADHFGGAPYFQQKYGTRVVLSAADWDLIENPPAPPPTPARGAAPPAPAAPPVKAPRRDIVATEGQPLTVGDTKFTFVMIPGHTPGSTGVIFPVKEGRTTHTAAMYGGSILTPGRISDDAIQQYVRSVDHFADVTKRMNADVEIQNHPLYDGIVEKLNKLKTRKPGERHPFVVGKDSYQRFLTVMSECTKAQIGWRASAPKTP
jgi:metallo-beta-lactamase class B